MLLNLNRHCERERSNPVDGFYLSAMDRFYPILKLHLDCFAFARNDELRSAKFYTLNPTPYFTINSRI